MSYIVHTHRMYNTERGCNVNYGAEVAMKCQYSFLDYEKCNSWVRDNGRACVCVGTGINRKSLIFLSILP
jgi:hypothetical protein